LLLCEVGGPGVPLLFGICAIDLILQANKLCLGTRFDAQGQARAAVGLWHRAVAPALASPGGGAGGGGGLLMPWSAPWPLPPT